MNVNNNWCCEVIAKTINFFNKDENYSDTCDRSSLFGHWHLIGLDKRFCDNCQKLWKAEHKRLEKDLEQEAKEWEEEWGDLKCSNCQKEIDWKGDKGMFGGFICLEHNNRWCKVEGCQSDKRPFCSRKCIDEVEDKEEREWFLRNFTETEIYQEIERRKSLHKKMVRQCQSCRKETNGWVEMDLDMLECRECYEVNNEWGKSLSKNAEKRRIERGEEKLPWVTRQEEKEKRGCYWWCADDCLQGKR